MSKQEWRNRYNFPAEKELIRLVDANPGMYGSMMSIISQMWREKDPIGAFTVGPCYGTTDVHGNYFNVVAERDRLRKALEEARKISFPRQPNGEGGWTIKVQLLDEMNELIDRKLGYAPDAEQLEEILLMIERMLVGQEGEGNQ